MENALNSLFCHLWTAMEVVSLLFRRASINHVDVWGQVLCLLYNSAVFVEEFGSLQCFKRDRILQRYWHRLLLNAICGSNSACCRRSCNGWCFGNSPGCGMVRLDRSRGKVPRFYIGWCQADTAQAIVSADCLHFQHPGSESSRHTSTLHRTHPTCTFCWNIAGTASITWHVIPAPIAPRRNSDVMLRILVNLKDWLPTSPLSSILLNDRVLEESQLILRVQGENRLSASWTTPF